MKMMIKSIEQGGKEGRSEMEWKIGEEKRHREGNSRKYDETWPNYFRKCDDQVRGLIWMDLYPEQGSRESQGSRQVCSEFKAEECPEGLKTPKVKTEMNYNRRGLVSSLLITSLNC